MPNRIIRDWTDSDRFDGISAEAERLFVRLVMKADDYGRFHAENRRVKAACFPLLTTLRPSDVDGWLLELAERRLVWRYRVDDRDLLAIPRFRQRLKQSIPKFPPPPGMPDDWMPDDENRHVPGSSRKFPLEAHSETDAHSETETDAPPPADTFPEIPESMQASGFPQAWADWLAYRKKKVTPRAARMHMKGLESIGPENAIRCIESSISNDYQGLFPEKFRTNGSKTPRQREIERAHAAIDKMEFTK